MTVPLLTPGIWSLWHPNLYCQTLAMVWSGREDTGAHATVLPAHGARWAPAFLCSDVEIISPGLAISAFGLTLKASICLDTVMSSLQSNPRALSSQSLVFPGTQLSLLVSKELQAGKHHRAWRELSHGLLKRTTNQRVKRCLGSHIAQFPQAGNTKAPRGEGTGPRTAASPQDALYKLEMVPNWIEGSPGPQ